MIGVVGDDTTGSVDIGVMFRRAGRSVRMLTAPASDEAARAGVLIIDTDSRLDPRDVAYTKVADATRFLRAAGCTRFYKKTCSVFRGNPGAELDAMLDTLGAPTAIISAAYPELGRTTLQGRQYLEGRPLEKSSLAHDPIHPRTTSDLCAIIREQSARSCAVVPIDTVRAGPGAVRKRLRELAPQHGYLVVDGETQDDLRTLADAASEFTVFGGSAGFAAAWPSFLPPVPPRVSALAWPVHSSIGLLYVSGSLTAQTRRQTARLRESGVFTVIFDPGLILAGEADCKAWLRESSQAALHRLRGGESVLVTTKQDPTDVASAQKAAAGAGTSAAVFSRKVSGLLAELSSALLDRVAPAALVVAGGDTSGAISRRLGITGCHLLEELEPGIPLCLADGIAGPLLTVFKSGSFGSDEFLIRAGERVLQRLGQPVTP